MSERSSTNLEAGNYLFSQEYHPEQTAILGRSILDLFRAFSNNSMVAFVGSGTSVALGYPTWESFARKLVAHVTEQCDITLPGKPDDSKYLYSKRLADAVKKYKLLFDGNEPRNALAQFDMIALASEMAAELRRIRTEPDFNGRSEDAAQSSDAAPADETAPRTDASDTSGKAEKPAKSLEDFYHDIFCMKKREDYLELPKGEDWFAPVVQRMQNRLGRLVGSTASDGSSRDTMSLPPDYVVGDALARALCNAPRVDKTGASAGHARISYRKLLGEQRPSLDVLACLHGNWKISRFVTLNYDHEIERQLEDHTYPFFSLTPQKSAGPHTAANGAATGGRPAHPKQPARSRLGERALTVDLCGENTAELLLFAANFSPAHVQVLHLHGSVRDPATMIVTDRDYNQRYFAQGAWPSVLGDGQELLFRGNAILFVGVGMNEDELLRPLRILAQAPSRDGRPVFTLLPSASHAEDTALAVKLYQRYGIRSIFYGTELGQDHEFGDLSDHPLRCDYRSRCAHDDDACADKHDQTDLASLQDELEFLGSIQHVIRAQAALKALEKKAQQSASNVEPPSAGTAAETQPDPVSASEAVGSDAQQTTASQPPTANAVAETQPGPINVPETVGSGKPDDAQDHLQQLEYQRSKSANARAELMAAVEKRRATAGEQNGNPATSPDEVGLFGVIPTKRLPRLRLTPWHEDVFALVSLCLEKDRFDKLDVAQLEALGAAVGSLQSAIRTRALLDALDFIALRARGWRRRWSRSPGHKHKQPAFRRLPDDSELEQFLRRHVGLHEDIGIAPAFTNFVGSAPVGEPVIQEILGCGKWLVICQWPAGRGKGYLASLLATRPTPGVAHRIVISFNQSCEFDSCFDLIAGVIRLSRQDRSSRIDCVLTHVDVVFNKAAKRPQLAEWDKVLRELTVEAVRREKIRLIVLCEHQSTSDYFSSITGKDRQHTCLPSPHTRYAEAATRKTTDLKPAEEHSQALSLLFTRCKSRWLVLFLCQLIDWVEQGGRRRTPAGGFAPTAPVLAASHSADEFRRCLIDEAWNRLRQTQDPRQRVAAVIDVAIARFERHVIAYGNRDARLEKILAFAVLRNLFLLAMPIRPELIRHFPEIRKILHDYGETRRTTVLVDNAVALLKHLRLVIPLYGHRGKTLKEPVRIGLHGSTRSYLLSKKSLPFTHFGRREHAAITVLPVLAEDVVALEPDDFKFTQELFEGLIAAARHKDYDQDRVLPAECIRAAFGLLRGSMRLGTVLRAAATQHPGQAPLDDYFRQLLAIRRAVLHVANCPDPDPDPRSKINRPSFAWPLYEREWVWLFNEMGVVRLLQGEMRDACALLEQAIEFEETRLLRNIGHEHLLGNASYEHLIYQARGASRFSVSRLRIFMNLSTAALERGAFDRISRIVQRDIANLRLHLPGMAPGSAPAPTSELQAPAPIDELQDSAPVPAEHRTHAEQAEKHTSSKQVEAVPALPAESFHPHRELEILTLVAGLIGARVQYLQGAIGGAEAWLREHRRWVLSVGVHGLTAAFFKVYADVQQRKGAVARTMKYLAVARTEAEASCRTDVILGVMLAEAEQARDTQAADSALQLRHHLGRLRKIEGEAQRLGLTQVEATVCLVRARLYLGFGEYRSAREDIMSALTTTTSKGMRVKRIAALVILAALMATEDTTDTARHEALQLLSTARAEAERMGYKLAAINAMELEIVLNRRGSVEDWATSRARVAVDARTASSVAG